MAYCLDHDIPIFGFCRGSQMLCVVSVATMIQDFPVWFASHNLDYNYEHRREISEGERIFTKLVNSSPSTLQVIVTLWVTAVIHFKTLVTHSSPCLFLILVYSFLVIIILHSLTSYLKGCRFPGKVYTILISLTSY